MCSATTQKYTYQVSSLNRPNMYIGNSELTNRTTDKRSSYNPLQTVVLTLSVLLCLFSCLTTVSLSYKWHMDTNRQIENLVVTMQEVIHDLNAFTDIVKDELIAKRINNNKPKEQKDQIEIGADYQDLENDWESDKFMGKDLMDNNWPSKTYQGEEPQNPDNRKRRNAAGSIAPIIAKHKLNSVNDGKSNAELIEEFNEENTVKTTYDQRKPRKMGSLKKKPAAEQADENGYEDMKESPEVAVAAHFIADPSKYNVKTHTHYSGNGRLKHPDGDFRDWTQYLGGASQNIVNHLAMKNGKVEVSIPGYYYIYAQIYYSDQHDINGYYIMNNDQKIFGCTTTRHRDTQSDSCYTGGVTYFNSKDMLSIKGLDSERFLILDPVKSFFGLFKLPTESMR